MPKKLLLGVLSLFAASALLSSCQSMNSALSGDVATLGDRGIFVAPSTFGFAGTYVINVDLKPTRRAIANTNYIVDLYENGKLRASSTVSFNQPEINVQADKIVYFPASRDEYDAYLNRDISHIFSVRVHEPVTSSQTPTPVITIISPNGGEQWHIGDSAYITWKSVNWKGSVGISLSYDSGKTWQTEIFNLPSDAAMPNTGSFEWKVVRASPSTHCRVRISIVSNSFVNYVPAISANDFTISP